MSDRQVHTAVGGSDSLNRRHPRQGGLTIAAAALALLLLRPGWLLFLWIDQGVEQGSGQLL